MKKYEIKYGNCKVNYTAQALEEAARKVLLEYRNEFDYARGYGDDVCDGLYLKCAVAWFCYTHLMASCQAHLKHYDADTRGDQWQEWLYDGGHRGYIFANVIDK